MKAAVLYTGMLFFICSCVKDRVCECKNSNGIYKAGDVKTTRHQAKKYCESLSAGETKCYLK